jgi:hypothetical protein
MLIVVLLVKNVHYMAKEREGKYHPPKGKPSSVGKVKASELQIRDIDNIEQSFELADKYTTGDTEEVLGIHIRHPNRDVQKNRKEKSGTGSKIGTTVSKTTDERSVDALANENKLSGTVEELPGMLTKSIFTELADYTSSCCITVYLPTHKAGVEVNEQLDALLFKNALQKISILLYDRQITTNEIERILAPGYELLRNEDFWRKLSEGLAVFIADGFFKFVKMPVAPKEETLVNKSFYISQLIPLLASKEHFYLLVISKKQAKLFRADAFGMQFIALPEMPNGIDDVVHLEEKYDQTLSRTGSSGDGSGATYHGIGAGKPDEKANVGMYLEEVDDTIWKEVLHSENAPLLLAGVEYLIPIYKQVSDYNFIWFDAITGSHEHDDINSLYELAIEKMQPYFQERQIKALANFGNQSATNLTSSVPEEIIPAAHYAKVAHLFIQKDQHIWGGFDELNNMLTLHETQDEDDECLLDKAAIKTILNGGEVHILPKEKMPTDSKIAALMRY